MRHFRSRLLCILLLLPATSAAGRALPAATIPAPSALCRAAILLAERSAHVPDRLLDAIAAVESGRRDPVSGAVYPWPWTINVEGQGHFYDSKAEAIAAVKAFQAAGARSIDVGCMQVSLLYHPDAFSSLEQAFDPVANAAYGARFLVQLFGQTNAWPLAAAAYHSLTPDIGADYAKKVLAAWGVPQLPVGAQAVISGQTLSPVTPHPGLGSPPGRVAVLLPNGNEPVRVLPMPGLAAAPGVAGRGLDAYRAMPIAAGGLRFSRAS
jgi:soluble lytic murein transglycosylase-like protein